MVRRGWLGVGEVVLGLDRVETGTYGLGPSVMCLRACGEQCSRRRGLVGVLVLRRLVLRKSKSTQCEWKVEMVRLGGRSGGEPAVSIKLAVVSRELRLTVPSLLTCLNPGVMRAAAFIVGQLTFARPQESEQSWIFQFAEIATWKSATVGEWTDPALPRFIQMSFGAPG